MRRRARDKACARVSHIEPLTTDLIELLGSVHRLAPGPRFILAWLGVCELNPEHGDHRCRPIEMGMDMPQPTLAAGIPQHDRLYEPCHGNHPRARARHRQRERPPHEPQVCTGRPGQRPEMGAQESSGPRRQQGVGLAPLVSVSGRQKISLGSSPDGEAMHVDAEAAQGADLAEDERVCDRWIAASQVSDPHVSRQ